jgi:hypothetical protein
MDSLVSATENSKQTGDAVSVPTKHKKGEPASDHDLSLGRGKWVCVPKVHV